MKLSGDYLLQSNYGSFIIKESETPYRSQRNCKDRVFRLLFQEPAYAWELFRALEDRPLETIQRLSDAYALSQGLPWGDFQVLVININWEKQHPILSKCRALGEYAQFVHQVRSNLRQEGVNRDEALRSAVGTCIEQGILKEFLETHRSEVEDMLFDITEEEFLEIRAEEMAEVMAQEMLQSKLAEMI